MKILKVAIFFLLVFLFGQCSKEVLLVKLQYAEAKCSNPWETTEIDDDEMVKASVSAYLENELAIKNADISIQFDANEAEACEACSCKSGRQIKIVVEEGFIAQLEGIGFVKI